VSQNRGAVKVTNVTRGTVVGTDVYFAATWWGRARGWLGHPEPANGAGLLLSPCKGIHMVGMKFPIDVAFLDKGGNVVAVYAALQPWQRTRIHNNAQTALELPNGTLAKTGTVVGDLLTWEEAV
jgi:uncharacterized membrane protein (UPF0127 family)